MEDMPTPQCVGREFVRQYYTLLNKAPWFLYRFYNENSSFIHGGLDTPSRKTKPVVGQRAICDQFKMMFHDCRAKICQVNSQATLENGVVVQVIGEISYKGRQGRRFTQTFILAQESPKKYYVHNDIFHYQDELFVDEGFAPHSGISEAENGLGVVIPGAVRVPDLQADHHCEKDPCTYTTMSPGLKKTNSAVARLKQDYLRLKKDPVPYVVAEPLPSNILEWHYVVTGPENTPYDGGRYHGKLVFSPEFPYKPPSIYMITPNGRFKTNMRLCLSISDYHPDTWNPAWSVSTILTGLLSFMTEKSPTLGSIEQTDPERRELALQSLEFNLHNKTFCQLFPETVEEIKAELKRRAEAVKNGHMPGDHKDETATSGSPRRNPSNGSLLAGENQEQGPFQAALTNIIVCICVVLFALVVKYVLAISNSTQ